MKEKRLKKLRTCAYIALSFVLLSAFLIIPLFLSVNFANSASASASFSSQTLERAKNRGRINIGVRIDMPGIGLKKENTYEGFDIDVAKYIANELGFSDSQIDFKEVIPKQRETLIMQDEMDIVVAAYSISENRRKMISFAGPYFVAGQDLLINKDEMGIKGPQDLIGKKVCGVTGSTTVANLKSLFQGKVEIMEQPNYVECISALSSKMVDAVTGDDIILAGLMENMNNSDLQLIGNTFTEEIYGVGIKKGDVELAERINVAIEKMESDGSWKKFLENNFGHTNFKYNEAKNPPKLDPISIIEAQRSDEGDENTFSFSKFFSLFSKYDILGAFLINIELSLWAGLFSLLLGVILVIMTTSPISSLNIPARAFVSFFRNIPLTIIMAFMVLVVFTQLRLQFSPRLDVNFFWLAIIALTLYHSAYVHESLRSGINSIPIGQAEAARSLGLTFGQSIRKIILPQALRGAIAPLGSNLRALIKNTTVASVASVATETSTLMSNMIEFDPQLSLAIFLVFAMGYAVIIIPIGVIFTRLSDRLAVRR